MRYFRDIYKRLRYNSFTHTHTHTHFPPGALVIPTFIGMTPLPLEKGGEGMGVCAPRHKLSISPPSCLI